MPSAGCVTEEAAEARLRFWRAVPKAELHLHFEGAIPQSFFGGEANGSGAGQAGTYQGLVEALRWRAGHLREPAVIEAAARAMAEALIADGVCLAEIHVSAGSLAHHGGVPAGDVLRAVTQGLRPYRDRLAAGLILDLVRHHGPDRAAATFEAAMAVAGEVPLLAIGLGGYERQGDAAAFAPLFAAAREAGLRTVAHGGEQCGPGSVEDALGHLGADRIGHGTGAARSRRVMDRLSAAAVPVEVCLTSNLATGVVAAADQHPLPAFLERGIAVVLSSDDPAVFGTDLAREFALAETLGCSRAALLGVARRGFDASFLDAAIKARLLGKFENAVAGFAVAGLAGADFV